VTKPSTPPLPEPRRVLEFPTSTLGDTTLTFYITPGNTAGTLSTILPLKDGNQRHVGILVGGRDTNYEEGGVTYLTDGCP
jgi:metallo-beta-lactamase class B